MNRNVRRELILVGFQPASALTMTRGRSELEAWP